MKLLIIEDDASLGLVISELLIRHDCEQAMPVIDQLDIVRDLESALARLDRYDAVLCDGEFPLSTDRGLPGENWAIVASHALKANITIAIYSGNPEICRTAAMCGLPALGKPAKTEFIYNALTPGKGSQPWNCVGKAREAQL